jgi:hypothetical protein
MIEKFDATKYHGKTDRWITGWGQSVIDFMDHPRGLTTAWNLGPRAGCGASAILAT